MMGGTISLVSVPDHGSTFHFTVRLAHGPDHPAKRPDARTMYRRVLLMESHDAARRVLLRTMESWGIDPASAVGYEEALAELETARQPFELILIDVSVPEGLALSAEVRRRWKKENLSVVLMGNSPLRDPGETLGITAFLTKPVSPTELRTVLEPPISPKLASTPGSPGTRPNIVDPTRGLSVLLAEDNPVNQALCATLLKKAGHRVVIANNGREALAAHGSAYFDVILMDLQMPEMGGFETTARIREKERVTGEHVPIVALTAHAMAGDREKCLEAGMDAYLAKPIGREELFDTLDALRLNPAPSLKT
jgi:CheY-like chemotaxis protein